MSAPPVVSVVRDDWPEARKAVYRAIEHAASHHPRSMQKRIGPSEIGVDCMRRIGYTLLDVAKQPRTVAWRAIVGVGVHSWLDKAFDTWDENLVVLGLAVTDGQLHWQTEKRVPVGRLAGMLVSGTLDLYHAPTCTVIDHKILGPSSLKEKRSANYPGNQYRAQLHFYGVGATMLGLPVKDVAINALPAAGELKDGWWWSEPLDPLIAQASWFRLESINEAVTAAGVDALDGLPTDERSCAHCPWFLPGSKDVRIGCPGVGEAADPAAEFRDLLGPNPQSAHGGA